MLDDRHPSPCGYPDAIPCICPREESEKPLTLGQSLAARGRPAGWVRIYSDFSGGHRWWRVECLIPHEPNTVSRWWKARWDGPRGAVTSALEHLAAHAVRRVALTPFEEVAAGEG